MVGGHGRPIDEILGSARQRLHRLDPVQAYDAMRDGALMVDIRPRAQQAAEGRVPGALHVERNVLEWRFDPGSPARLRQATGYEVRLIIMCSQGYASSLRRLAARRRPAQCHRPGRGIHRLGTRGPARHAGITAPPADGRRSRRSRA